jgi:hypothetical protein
MPAAPKEITPAGSLHPEVGSCTAAMAASDGRSRGSPTCRLSSILTCSNDSRAVAPRQVGRRDSAAQAEMRAAGVITVDHSPTPRARPIEPSLIKVPTGRIAPGTSAPRPRPLGFQPITHCIGPLNWPQQASGSP